MNSSKFPVKESAANLKRFLLDESGLELSEYAVAAALVAIGAVTVFAALGDAIGVKIDDLAAILNQ
jgi:pilus assembly protein Flp/PilA